MGVIQDSWDAHCKDDYRREFGSPKREYGAVQSMERLERLIRSKCPVYPCYVSVYAFEEYVEYPKYKSAIINTSFHDFDNAENPQLAFNDAVIFYNEMLKRDVTPRLYFSGNKGIAAYLDFEPVTLDARIKKLALESFQRNIMNKLSLGTMDVHVIGDLARISRIPNTKHQNGKTWCIPVSIEDVEKGFDHVRALAASPGRVSIEIHSDNDLPEVLQRFARHIERQTETERLVAQAKNILRASKPTKHGRHFIRLDAEKVKSNNTLASVIGTKDTIIRCPFHNDHDPSLHIDHDKQLWYCFGCGKGGDVISWVMERDKCDFIAALTRLS